MQPARTAEPAQAVVPTADRGVVEGGRAPSWGKPLPALPTVPRWLAAAVLLALVPVTVLPAFGSPGIDAWWPANALVAALLLVVGSRERPLAGVLATLALALVVALVYQVGPLLAIPAALTATLPAYVAATLLRRSHENLDLSSDGFGGTRYHLVLIGMALAAGALVVLVVGPDVGVVRALQAGLVSAVGSLAAFLVVLPVLVPVGERPRTGSGVELWAQRVALVATVPLSSLVGAALVLAFPVLSWAGLRATRREAHVQTCVFAFVVYVAAVSGAGPLDPQRQALTLGEDLALLPLYLYLGALAYLVVPMARAVERLSQSRLDAQRTAQTLQRAIGAAHTTIFMVTGPDGRITHFNEGAAAATGWTEEEARGRTFAFLVPQEEVSRKAEELGVPADFDAVCQALLDRETRTEWQWQHRDGTLRTVSISLNQITDPEGSLVGCLTVGDDVTERVRSQRALETALDREHQSVLKLQEVDHVKQELVSNVSHELRTPITSIAGYAELLADSSLGELTRPQRDALQRIERNALRLQSLVDDLLTLSRSESGRLQMARESLDLGQLVRSTWELFEEQLRHRSLETELALAPQPVVVVGDRDALERVVVNLVSNAVKFTPDGGSVRLAVTRGSDGSALLVVRDSGIGIDTKDQEKLFTRFFRARAATDAAIQGTGLGLSIVQALVSQHGGRVSIRSRPGEGTRVTVELPA